MNQKDIPTLEDQINNLQTQLLFGDGETEEYSTLVKNFETLYNLKLKQDGTFAEREAAITRERELNQKETGTFAEREAAEARKLELKQREEGTYSEKAAVDAKQLELMIAEAQLESNRTISKKDWLTAGVTIGSLLLIMGYEQTHVLSSKALGFVKR